MIKVLIFLLLSGQGLAVGSGNLPTGASCYTDINCMGSIIPFQTNSTSRDCCVETKNGQSYSYDGICIVHTCNG